MLRMPGFNLVRLCILVAVIAWTFIVLGLAAFFEHLIISNELTRFVPLAIFVSVITLIFIPAALLFGSFKRVLPITQTRVELGFIGFLAIMWFALGVYTSSEEPADVECDFEGDGFFEESEDYSSDTFHSQYRVLQAFSLFNAILLICYLLFVLVLAIRHHSQGRRQVWTAGITSYPWFGDAGAASENPSKFTLPTAHITEQPMSKGEKMDSGAPMRAGGHYLIYIPAPPRSNRVAA